MLWATNQTCTCSLDHFSSLDGRSAAKIIFLEFAQVLAGYYYDLIDDADGDDDDCIKRIFYYYYN